MGRNYCHRAGFSMNKNLWDLHTVLVRKAAGSSFRMLSKKVGAFLVCTLGNEYVFVPFLLIFDFMILLCDFLLRKQIIVILPAFLGTLY